MANRFTVCSEREREREREREKEKERVLSPFIIRINTSIVEVPYVLCTRGDQKVRGKELLNRIAFVDCNENE